MPIVLGLVAFFGLSEGQMPSVCVSHECEERGRKQSGNGNSVSLEGPGRDHVVGLLTHILVDRVHYNERRLIDVISELQRLSVKLDPLGQGVDFKVKPSLEKGLDLREVKISMKRPLHRVRLVTVLNAVVDAAEKSIDYRVHDGGIAFIRPAEGTTPLETCSYNVPMGTFRHALTELRSFQPNPIPLFPTLCVDESDSTAKGENVVLEFFRSVDVDLPDSRVSFLARMGKLWVRTTSEKQAKVRNTLHWLKKAGMFVDTDRGGGF